MSATEQSIHDHGAGHSDPVDRSGPPLVDMRDISIAFGGIHAVDGATIDLPAELSGFANVTAAARAGVSCRGPWSVGLTAPG